MADMKQIDQRMQEFKALLAKYNTAGVDAFHFLMRWEDDAESWCGDKDRGSGFASFPDMLKFYCVTHGGSIEYQRLANFRAGFEKIATTKEGKSLGAIEAARLIGPEGVMKLSTVPEDAPSLKYAGCGAVEGIVRDLANKSEARGLQVSAQHSSAVMREHYLPPKTPETAPPTHKDALAAAKERIAELEAEIAKKDRTIARLTAKVADLEARAVKRSVKPGKRSQRSEHATA